MRKSRSLIVCILLIASVFLLQLAGPTLAMNGDNISQWNSVTEDTSDHFSVDICIDKGREVEFVVSSNLSYTWIWLVNEEEIKESEGTSSNLSYVFEEYGIYNVSAVGKGENESAECASWNVTVSLVIGKENDLTEIEGFENYTFSLSKRPKRIVSLAPSCTETLFAIGAGESVVGVTSFCNYPPEVVNKVNNGEIEVIGGYSTPDIDKITHLNPDIIVAAHNPGIGDVISSLVESGYNVIDLHSTDIEDIIDEIRFMGKVLKCRDNATNLVNELENRLERVKEKVGPLEEEERPRVFYTCGNFWTPGNDTFINDVISAAGGKNIAANYGSGYFQISPVDLTEENPQVIICPSESTREQILTDNQLSTLNAVKYGRIYVINGDIICRPSARIVDAVETVYGYLDMLIKPTMCYPTLQYNAQRTGDVPGKGPVTSSLLWQSPNETHGCIQAGPVVHDGKMYVETWYSGMGGEDSGETNALFCLDVDSGEIVWMNEDVFGASTAAISDGRLFIGTMNGNITCVNAANGEILWSKKIEANPSWYGVASSPLVFNEMIYVLSFSDGTLHAFSFDGTEQWNFSTGGQIFCYSSPSAYGDKIFFAGNDDGQHALYCVNLSSHEEVWKFTTETEIRGSPTIWTEEGMVFFTTRYMYTKEYGIYAVNITSGEEIWHKKHKSSWASPALSNGKLFIGGSSADTTFYCYNAKNGSLIWENKEMGGAIDSSPVVADGKVYFGTSEVDGTVYALDATSGLILWNYTLYTPLGFGGGYNVASHPAITNCTLFIGVDNIGVLAFRDSVFWEGEVAVTKNTTVNVTAHNSGESYGINQTTALGALDAAAEAGRFNYTVSDEWYASWGSLTVDSIAGKKNDPVTWDGWLYWVNYPDDPMPMVGVNLYEVKDGDVVTFYYGGMSTTPDNAPMVLKIHVHVQSPVL
ncbi:MAG: helical backbone metal receptor [Methanophagales archaeon]|nr:helical backbone metal receptor [Methanophagales archaeon]